MGSHYRQYTALVTAVTLTERLRNKWSGFSIIHTPEMHAKFLIWKIGQRMRRWPEVRNFAWHRAKQTVSLPKKKVAVLPNDKKYLNTNVANERLWASKSRDQYSISVPF